MKKDPISKYKPFPPIKLINRSWPDNVISGPPQWCSVDLRDGNQALVNPMNLDEKMDFFKMLCKIGFKEIEVGFPSSSAIEFDFMRKLIEDDLIPADVTIQVLTPARRHLIEKTFESLKGAKRAILHLYNSTSPMQRKIVFNKSRKEIIDIATEGIKIVKELAGKSKTQFILEYTPESFSQTELDFALDICNRVCQVWQPTEQDKCILNLPATVEMATPNVYADQIEWMSRHLANPNSIIISLHTHNDRGTAVAATELALLAGAQRVEGTIFGNGERTGNVDIITLAMNMYSQGVHPDLDLENISEIVNIYEKCTKIPVHIRHPYAGELVYTAFSGSHQDAINKGMAFREDQSTQGENSNAKVTPLWEVPYLPIDPSDLGKTYEAIIRINSQSGKGGVSYILKENFGIDLPRDMHGEFSRIIQTRLDRLKKEIQPDEIYKEFEKEYLNQKGPIEFIEFKPVYMEDNKSVKCTIRVLFEGQEKTLHGNGNGPIDACKIALKSLNNFEFTIESFSEHSLTKGSDSKAIAYIQIKNNKGFSLFGAGIDSNITIASIKALVSALNRDFKLN